MWSDWLVFCDCGFLSVCPLMEKNKRLMEASGWQRLTEGETASCSDGQGHAQFSSVAQSCPTLSTPWIPASQASLSITNSWSSLKLMSIHLAMHSNHLISSSPFPPAFNLFQCQGLFQWVSSHEVAKVLELQHQSFQWIFRTNFL